MSRASAFELDISCNKHRLTAASGEIVLIKGAVGSGKSRFLSQLAGLTPLPEGAGATLMGSPWPDLNRHNRHVRMLFDQTPPLWMGASVADELAFGSTGNASAGDIDALLECWRLEGVDKECDLYALDRTQSIRLALATMECSGAGLILLDNPTASLPIEEIRLLQQDIRTWQQRSPVIVAVACNRWQDWTDTADQVWCVDDRGPLPQKEH